ncbi:hypothetical protein B7R21_15470 [Subtercola boreus]|uniref:Bacterial Ig domain-containing protein n=1 Tax=Subtercola boreus TaxID=120213 RepID=A0A3E0VCG7_9MICO|nr:hypothetical protein B7R21_15470 [Subtercola boreus]
MAAASLGLGGLLAAPAAFANTAATPAPVSGDAYQEQAAALLSDPAVQAVGRDASGNVVVVKVAGSDSSGQLDAFDARFDNVVVKSVSAPLTDYSTDDVVGGAGYFAPDDPEAPSTGAACSIGFSAWSPSGKPAVLSAGHCTSDGAASDTYLTLPSGDEAGGGATTDFAIVGALGTFGFSQYGGIGNTKGTNNKDSIDIAVIDLTNKDPTTLPEVTDWTTSESEDLSKSTKTITSVGTAEVGKAVAKSGRTTGYTDGATVDVVDGWANVGGRIVYGFGSALVADHGDSGGAVFQGTKAVGILSGGSPATGSEPAFMWASDLPNDLAHTDGYTVKLAISAPTLTAPADGGNVERGAGISGTAPISSTVIITPKTGDAFTVDTDANGAFSFPAPSDLGTYEFTAQAKSGFNTSSKKSFSVKVVPVPLKAPVITSPADGSSVVTSLTEVTGTGTPGTKITVKGDVQGTDTVDGSGNWSVPADLSYGTVYSIDVTQSAEGQTSPVATSVFSVIPTQVGIITPVAGSTLANADKPASATGAGITGATISATVNGVSVPGSTTVVDGKWSIVLGDTVVVGANDLVVRQSIDGASSEARITFTVQAAAGTPTATPAPTPGNGGSSGGGNGSGSGSGSGSGTGGGLAHTGLEVTGISVLAAIMLALGSAFLVTRRRSSRNSAL